MKFKSETKLGEFLYMRRLELYPDLPRRKFADRARISHTYLFNLEHGYYRNPSLKTLTKLAQALEYSEWRLVKLVDPK